MSQDNNKEEKFKDRYVRWQKNTIDQLSFLNYLIIIIGGGILAYELNLIFPESQFEINQIKWILFSSFCLSISVVFGILTAINRLRDFRKTKDLVKSRWENESKEKIKDLEFETDKLGNWTWRFFWLQIILFISGVIILSLFIVYYLFNLS